MASKKNFYNFIKLAGMLSFIPLIMVSGPLLGFLTGDFLKKKFGTPDYVMLICIAIGFIGSIIELIRIIRIARKIKE